MTDQGAHSRRGDRPEGGAALPSAMVPKCNRRGPREPLLHVPSCFSDLCSAECSALIVFLNANGIYFNIKKCLPRVKTVPLKMSNPESELTVLKASAHFCFCSAGGRRGLLRKREVTPAWEVGLWDSNRPSNQPPPRNRVYLRPHADIRAQVLGAR